HEGPISISRHCNVPLQAGMIVSNEPGYYQENGFGIRLENMMLVKANEDSRYLSFETISLVPFDHKFILQHLISELEKNWLEEYYQKIASLEEFLK
ncbi:MAG: M24 family metallopeptidase C-terminal domain-containing protein, partial [Holosporaceae bacterium]|nr:M24 family metallopeptidase C-terminal domain-containing protein [Holosporaceae bacterium]